ncbi:cobalamin transport operon protein [Halorhabdus rudnickae]|uniref:cobalamin transport operon protein n=1 Tax=Halorhabdus rudnickae TaxID=1775544 RepID=UPI0010833E22|nr:cobalamin transport operon protein [Halorhabdus rudnickae]
MERWKQYSVLAGLLATFTGLGYWGFTATGGSLPYAKRFAATIQRGVETGGGSIVDLGRGVVIAGPIRNGGLVLEWLALLGLLAAVGVGLYVYGDRLVEGGRYP